MNNERMRIELSIQLHDSDAHEALKEFCDHLRSGLSTYQNFEVTSLDVRDATIDLQLDEIHQTLWIDIRSSDNTDGLCKRIAAHIEHYFDGHPSIALGSTELDVEMIPRRREAIAAQKAKSAKRGA